MRLIALAFICCLSWIAVSLHEPAAAAEKRTVGSAEALLAALAEAEAGDVITIADGTYRLTGKRFNVRANGTAEMPITVRAERLGAVTLELDTIEGFHISGAHWIFENLDIRGSCETHDRCRFAFHIVHGADHMIIRNNRLREFSAMIKGSSRRSGNRMVAADHVLIEGNRFSNSVMRKTTEPVTFIDVVGGDGWIVRANLLMDFAKDGGDRISYGAFMKGNSTNGLFDGNFVICSRNHVGGTRVGLSFGGGGTGRQWMIEPYEHKGGIMRNNIIADCAGVAIYLNRAADTEIHNNTLFRTKGIDVRFPQSSAMIRDNVFNGEIKSRDKGEIIDRNNKWMVYSDKFEKYYAAPFKFDFSVRRGAATIDSGSPQHQVDHDFCGNERRDGLPDRGAVEYLGPDAPCDRPLPAGWANSDEGPGQTDTLSLETEENQPTSRLVLDPDSLIAAWDGTPIDLTDVEFRILDAMSAQPNQVFSNGAILAVIRTSDPNANDPDIAVKTVAALRRKFRGVEPGFTGIKFHPGEGFSWQE